MDYHFLWDVALETRLTSQISENDIFCFFVRLYEYCDSLKLGIEYGSVSINDNVEDIFSTRKKHFILSQKSCYRKWANKAGDLKTCKEKLDIMNKKM